jgi:hypothetical protein
MRQHLLPCKRTLLHSNTTRNGANQARLEDSVPHLRQWLADAETNCIAHQTIMCCKVLWFMPQLL